jgi:hypothetical protein
MGGVATGTGQVAVGANALGAMTSGACNVAVGFNAGTAVTTGSNNTMLGYAAGDTVVTGTQNTFLGSGSGGSAATTSEGNTAVGFAALGGAATSGAYNVVVGNNAGVNVTSGALNTLVGYSAGSAVQTGGGNTLIGRYGGTAALANNVVLSDGAGTIRFQANSTGAISFDGTNFGTSGQTLQSNGSAAVPTWVTPIWQNLGTLTLTSTTLTTLLSVAAATFRGVVINLSVSDVTGGNFHTDTLQVNHNGTTANVQVIGGAHLGTAPYTASAAVTAGNLVVSVTSASTNSTKYVGNYMTFAI